MEDPSESWQPPTPGALGPPWATLVLLYSLVMAAAYLLEVASHSLLVQATGPLLPPPVSTAWFSHQVTIDVTFTVLLPLSLTWTRSCWPLGGAFCHVDPRLSFLTCWASGRLLARVAADSYTSLCQPAWALGHHTARKMVFWAGGFWIILLGLGGPALYTRRDQASPAVSCNRTPAAEAPSHDQGSRSWGPVLDQLVFGFGVPLGVMAISRSILGAQLQLARLTGRPLLLGLPWATAAMLLLCWLPFHLLLLLKLLGAREAGIDLGEVWVLLRPLGFSLVGVSSWLHPLLYVCGDRAFRRRLCQVLGSCQGAGSGEGMEGTQAWPSRLSCPVGT
ncbi:C3a anaphylatoxin chemotactic receptor-like [Perognathus longimembris pacificus]|uniref:C3a anaphylatoxin chemotactic receptor-like n=1 Tax=Perognathus longimembris pacificus TaxID=214514 RepID=UPI002019128A|nr:C3a anaphylatoxin chemotactic receptor-like [Perognathus longimembris pacificus]